MEKWEDYTEEKLESYVVKQLEGIYDEARLELISCGYSSDVVHRAILSGPDSYGDMEVLSNIVNNTIARIKSGKELPQVYNEVRELVEFSIRPMIFSLQQAQPGLTRKEAMWCLLVSGFHCNVASKIAVLFSRNGSSRTKVDGVQDSGDDPDGNTQDQRVELLKRFNLSPTLASMLNQRVMDHANVYCTDGNVSLEQLKGQWPGKKSTGQDEWEDYSMIETLLGGYDGLSVKDEVEVEVEVDDDFFGVLSLVKQILEKKEQVGETKKWAQKRVIQVAKRLSSDLNELKMLRLESEIKRTRLMVLEKGCEIGDAYIDELEAENTGIREDIEAFNLCALVGDEKRAEVAKRGKNCGSKIKAAEKQHNKLKEELEDKKKQCPALREELVSLEKAQN